MAESGNLGPDRWRAVAGLLAAALTECDPERSPEGSRDASRQRAQALASYYAAEAEAHSA